MKKSVRVSAIFVALFLIQPPAIASVKAGSTCAKQGVKQIGAGKSFTCVKQGKKLVWNKGVAVKKPAAPVVALPQPSASPVPQPSVEPSPSPATSKISFTPWASTFVAEDMVEAALAKTSEYLGSVKPSNAYSLTIDPAITPSDREWITKMLDYTNGAFSDVLQGRVKVFLGTTHEWSASAMRSAGTWVGDPGGPFPCSDGSRDAGVVAGWSYRVSTRRRQCGTRTRSNNHLIQTNIGGTKITGTGELDLYLIGRAITQVYTDLCPDRISGRGSQHGTIGRTTIGGYGYFDVVGTTEVDGVKSQQLVTRLRREIQRWRNEIAGRSAGCIV